MVAANILVVEDNRIVAEYIKQQLMEMGFSVSAVATSGVQALAAAAEKVPDIVLMDIQLGEGMDGIDVAAQLRQTYQVPIIYLTAYADEKTFQRAKQTEPFGYLTKPFDERELQSAVEITLYKNRVESRIRESEEKYKALFQSASDAILVVDAKTMQILDANEAASRLYGYSHDALLRMAIDALSAEPSLTRMAFKEKDVLVPLRYHRKKDGTVFAVEVTANYLTIGGRATNISIIRDISHRLNAEKEKRKLEGQLHQAQKMEAIGTLAGGIAHDFNNILSAVIGFTELSMEEAAPESSLAENLNEVFTAGKRAKDLVNQILTFARRTEGEKKPVQVRLIAKEVLRLLRSSLPTSIVLQQDLRSKALVMADPGQIHQVFMNLCTNAAQAMEMDRGVLRVDMSDIRLEEKLVTDQADLKPGNYLRITIADTGKGISAEHLNSIFEPYFTTKEMGDGTGLGLAVVHGAVKNMGGEILVDSEPGSGAAFTLYLPVTASGADAPRAAAGPAPGGADRILFVDDEATIAKMGDRILKRLGYRVTVRTSSMEALALFQANPAGFDLVITDMTMPNMNGDDLAMELLKIRPDLPVILCTGYSKKISEASVLKLGVRALVYKPIVKFELAKTIRDVLENVPLGK